MPQVFIETPRLILREWKKTDHEPFIVLNGDKEVMEFFPVVKTREETLSQIERFVINIRTMGYGFFAAERKDNAQFIGFTGFAHPGFDSYFTPCVEIGWRLSKPNWGQGFATEAAGACLEYGFETLRFGEIYSFTSVHNKRSEQVMIKTGMIKQSLFEHPDIEEGSILRQHVLYKVTKELRIRT